MISKVKGKMLNLNLTAEWEQFISHGRVKSDIIRPEILESWQRCYEAGVDPYDGSSHLILTQPELEQLQSNHAELIETAWHFMVKLYEFVAGSGFIVLLSEEHGYIVKSVGDCNILDNATDVKLMTGTGWMETEVGTNGIGTALLLKKPVQVSGQEHYCKKLHSWTCSAAPIFDNDGQIMGALQMSGPSGAAHLHTLGMVVAAVEAISSQIRIGEKNLELTALNSSLQNIFQTMSDGAVIIDRQGIISHINPVAEQILGYNLKGTSIEYLLGKTAQYDKLLSEGQPFTDIEVRVDKPQFQFHCLVTSIPIKDEKDNTTGAVIFFNPINKIKKLTNRFSGAHAVFNFNDIIGNSHKLHSAIHSASNAAACASNVLITGESGTGKELFAQAIHNASSFRDGPFIALNCGAIPRELIASELFGYTEGAFTGAGRGGRPGKFEMATGGTLFLDEIGDMPFDQQVTLLRVLQERKIIRIGGDKVIPVDTRVICATNKNLQDEVKKGNFREDLYYRLNVIPINIPSLREREEDISLLFQYFVHKIGEKLNTPIEFIEPGILEYLKYYNWPGNVRELENVVERMINSANGSTLRFENLPPEIHAAQSVEELPEKPIASGNPEAVHENGGMAALLLERNRILELLSRYNGNISRVARELGISRNTVYRKMQFYDVSREFKFK
jgi:PAS domain S-box-containing protein